MDIRQYYISQNGAIAFTRQQASDFAKQIAGDFNPIHDVDATRFCVPGDLLFTVTLHQIGLSQSMHIRFADMVSDGNALSISGANSEDLCLIDQSGKEYLHVQREGEITNDSSVINQFAQEYVQFSGKAFPHILVSLWKDKGVMINPSRPLVIYESMSVELTRLNISKAELKMAAASFDVDGKRGNVTLAFDIADSGEVIGHGKKSMVCSGLRPFEPEKVDELVAFYEGRKTDYLAQQ